MSAPIFLRSSTSSGGRYDGSLNIRIQPLWLAVLLSLLLHGLALWQWRPELDFRMREPAEKGETRLPLRAHLRMPERAATALAPARTPAPAVAPSLPSAAPPVAPRTRPRVVPPFRPPVVAMNTPSPAPVAPVPVPDVTASKVPAPEPSPQPRPPAAPSAQGDFSAMLDARRRARGEVAPPAAESEAERRDRIVASNLGQEARASRFDPRQGGGVFQMQRMTLDRAEFLFYGWNKDIRRNSSQLIEVRRGDNPDIRIAVARRMIAIIREHEKGDFEWESYRLRRVITLSARPADNAGLEEFMLKEFFPGG